MCLKSQMIPDVPVEMVRVVHAVFPKGNLYIHLRDTLGVIYQDDLFEDLFPDRGQPAYAPWRLALVTVFQFMENLTDRQPTDAVRSRLDWKYALSLELTNPGFHHTVLSEFRTRLVALTAHEALDQENLLPKQHLMDAGYVDAEAILASQAAYQVDLVGPIAKDYRWQARE